MTFDVENPPPATPEIARTRAQLEAERAQLRRRGRWFFGGVAFTVVSFVASAIVIGRAHLQDDQSPNLTSAVIVFTPYVAMSLLVISNLLHERWFAGRSKEIYLMLESLGEVAAEQEKDIDTWCRDDNLVARYRAAVAAQGRGLMLGEWEAMRARREARA